MSHSQVSMAWKGNQKRVAAGKKGGRPMKQLVVAAEAVAIDDGDGYVEMADVEQPAAAEKAAAEKEAAEEQPACGLLALPWDWLVGSRRHPPAPPAPAGPVPGAGWHDVQAPARGGRHGVRAQLAWATHQHSGAPRVATALPPLPVRPTDPPHRCLARAGRET